MELRQLRYFVAVAEERHFRRAAQRLHIAQPAVSEQIRKLEAEIGTQLLNRTQRSVELTDAGTVLLEDARRILRYTDAAGHAARRAGDRSRTRLKLGYTAHGLPSVVPQTLSRLRTAVRPVRLELEVDDARSLMADLRSRHLDAAIVHLPGPTAGLRLVPIGTDEGLAAVPADRDRPGGAPVTLGELAGSPVIVFPRAVDPAFHDAVVSAFVGCGLSAGVVESQARTVDQLLLEVTAGAGVAIVSAAAAERMSVPGVDLRPLAGDALACTIAVVIRDEAPSVTLTVLLDELRIALQPARRPALALL
jgi:DNA-binding transcriptional LysR family regulator